MDMFVAAFKYFSMMLSYFSAVEWMEYFVQNSLNICDKFVCALKIRYYHA